MLKTTLIGHASLLIQSRDTTILTDPVWFDYLDKLKAGAEVIPFRQRA